MSTTQQYHSIRSSITANLTTIKSLLAQADNLHNIVSELDKNLDAQQKAELNANITNIYGGIDDLVAQTDDLFRAFVEYAKTQEQSRSE